MAPRQHRSGPAQRSSSALEAPEYEAPSNTLNFTAQRALQALPLKHPVYKLKQHLKDATALITESAALINDRNTLKVAASLREERRRAKQSQDERPSQATADELDEMRTKVEDMTQRMEESLRKIIDGQMTVSTLEETLRSTHVHASQQQPATQRPTQQPSQRSRRRHHDDDNTEAEDVQMADFEPTIPDATASQQQQQPPPLPPSATETFMQNLNDSKDRYQSLSLRTRYASNNDYVGFRRTVHDARYPEEDAPPLPNPSTWFGESGAPAAGLTARTAGGRAGGGAGDESDDDIAIARERISTKCPVTLLEFTQPLTSRKCPHTFQRDAILAMIEGSAARVGGSNSNNRTGPRNGTKAVQCPVTGCDEVSYCTSLIFQKGFRFALL